MTILDKIKERHSNSPTTGTPENGVVKKRRPGHKRELVGTIQYKKEEKTYWKNSEYYGDIWYKLKVSIENMPGQQIDWIYAFKSMIENEQIWNDIVRANYVDKRYIFYCYYNQKGYKLYNWEERPLNKDN